MSVLRLLPPGDTFRYEQAVYGSFPFWDRGYAVLAASPGCRPEWLEALRGACQRLGEPPAGAAGAGGLFALRLAGGPWMVVGVSAQGCDDRGRPGALAFHALFLRPLAYRRAGADPFALASLLRGGWTAETRDLPPGVGRVAPPGPPPDPADPRAGRIAAALGRGRRVAVEADGPIDGLAAEVWRALPGRVRARASVATWAFANGNRFDLFAAPRLAGVALDGSYETLESLDAAAAGASPAARRRLPTSRWMPYLGGAALAAGVGLGLAWRAPGRGEVEPRPTPRPAAAPAVSPPPAPGSYIAAVDPDPEQRRAVVEGLADLADRFGVALPADGLTDPSALMAALADDLRYRGRVLTPAELRHLAGEPGPDGALALRWHEQIRRFLPDRRLPDGFARGPLRWQLDTLGWSFHLDELAAPSRRSPPEVPHALADALAVDVPVRPTPLAGRYPALADYAAFLGRLPQR